MSETKYHQIPLKIEMADNDQPGSHTQLQITNPDPAPTRASSKASSTASSTASSKYRYQVEPADSIYSRNSSKSYRISQPPASNPSPAPSSPMDAINRLEVESTSTTSIPISIPYYYITNQSTSLDTVNLLGNNNGNSTPQYSNTSHIASPIKPTFGNTTPVSPNRGGVQKTSPGFAKSDNAPSASHANDVKEDAYFNQLPKRFSQFIIDQKNPFMAQKLDNLSLSSINSQDLARHNQVGYRKASNGTKHKYDARSYSTHSSHAASRSRKSNHTHRKSGTNTNSTAFSQADTSNPYSHARSISGDISNSMGSQATIFSTRPDLQQNTTSSNPAHSTSNNINYSRSGLKRSKTKARMYSTDSDSTLSRSKAIKFKDGSWIYRLKLKINKCISKLKHLKFRNFTASNKRTGSITRRSKKSKKLARAKSTLSKKYNSKAEPASIRNKISAPTNNPELGFRKVETIHEVDDELKYLAGAPEDSLNITEAYKDLHRDRMGQPKTTDSPGRYHHLSTYIDQQQNNYSQIKQHRFSSRSQITNPSYFKDEGNMSSEERQRRDGRSLDPARQSSLKKGSVAADTDVSNSTAPPLPPPHLDEYTLESFMIDEQQQNEVISLWRSYLKHVLSKRIQLRQEINLFRTFVADSHASNLNGFDIYEEGAHLDKGQGAEKDYQPMLGDENAKKRLHSQPNSTTNGENGYKAHQQQNESQMETPVTASNSGSESFVDTVSESASELNDVDSSTAKFQSAYLNRRSVLGDMLDYDSSDADSMVSFSPSTTSTKEEENDVASLMSSTRSRVLSNANSYEPSLGSADIGISKRYGTISRRSSTLRSNRQANQAAVAASPASIKRSHGIQLGLNSLNEV